MIIVRGRTSQIVPFQISNTLTGGGKTGLLYNTSGLIAYYKRELAATSTAISLATQTIGTWATGGFVEIDATHMPGSYELSLPNAAISASDASTWVEIYLSGVTNVFAPPLRIDLVAVDVQDAVRMALTALPNANAEAAGGLYTRGTGAGQIRQDSNGRIDANAKAWIDGTIPAVNVTGVPLIDAKYLLGTIFSTPATAGILDINLKNIANAAVNTAAAQLGVNAVNHGGTAQTGRDIGASVLLSAGTGAGQLDFTSGVVKANLVQILATALTETAGQIAAAFKQFFNIASPTSTMNVITTVTTATTATTATNLTNAPTAGDFTATMKTSLNAATPASVQNISAQTGDSFARLGAPSGASIDADILTRSTYAGGDTSGTTTLLSRIASALSISGGAVTVGTNNDKTGYALTAGEHTLVSGTDVPAALTAQGYTSTRAGYLDTLNGLVATVIAAIFGYLNSSVTTAGSWAKLVKDFIAAYVAAPSAVAIRTEIDNNSTKLTSISSDTQTILPYVADTDAIINSPVNANVLDSGTLQTATPTSATLRAGATGNYNGLMLEIYSGTAAGQAVPVTAYNSTTKIATVASWPNGTPDATSLYRVIVSGGGSGIGGGTDPLLNAVPGAYAVGTAGYDISLLTAIVAKTNTISGSTIIITSPNTANGAISIIDGDDYKNVDGRALFATTTFSNAPSGFTSGTLLFLVKTGSTPFSKAGVIVGATSCYVELTSTETLSISVGTFDYDLQATLSNGDIVTISQGTLNVGKDVR